jgi:peptidoglycan/xylan/chitin deacetylase (PgdA/CDA1 family)
MSVPFGERGGAVRGFLDAVCGRLPWFVAGGSVPDELLPVFHFHDVTAADLEPKVRFLAENGYSTVTAGEIAAHARGETRFGRTRRRVGLCFDDAWASLWTVARPILEQYGMTAIAYAIPARIEDRPACRAHEATAPGPDFVTWPELQALHTSGVVDVQCHTESHSMIFSASAVTGFVTPEYRLQPKLNRPQLSPLPALAFLEPDQLGAPLYAARSRMSDGLRVAVSSDLQRRCVEYVAREGDASFFDRLDWQDRLNALVQHTHDGTTRPDVESESDRDAAIAAELERGRAALNARLRTNTVRHICLPWGVSSPSTLAALKHQGYESAFANRMEGVFAVRRGDDPFWLKRLPNKYIFQLPGRGRRIWI